MRRAASEFQEGLPTEIEARFHRRSEEVRSTIRCFGNGPFHAPRTRERDIGPVARWPPCSLADVVSELDPPAEEPVRALLDRLSAGLASAVSAALPEPQEVVLLDYPTHSNVGDAAIWLGERALLRAGGMRIVYTADLRNTEWGQLAAAAAGKVVLLHGGGSFGDTWPRLQGYRERVFEQLTSSTIIQLPQTVHFADDRARDAARRAVETHGNVLLMARDWRSLAYFEAWFDAPSVLCTDGAFALGDLSKSRGLATQQLLVLGRTDLEDSGETWPDHVKPVDWLIDGPAPFLARASRLQRLAGSRAPETLEQRSRLALYDAWAKHRVRRGLAMLCRGEAVATDRLHAHIMCLLLGIPHAIVDNNYGKLSTFAETWTQPSVLARLVPTKAAAVRAAIEMSRGA